jgi:putative protease
MRAPEQKTPELLAPAGDWEAMRAAVANGADAVYFGLSNYNARHRAQNFSLAELPEVMRYLHGHNVRGYVTLNTLIFSPELSEAAAFGAALAEAGADAVIVQDLGLAVLLRRLAPALPLHGSTQMTLTEPLGIEFVRRLGVERVILARELALPEIRDIAAATEMPLEVFVHGALCVAYSGQCLTSEALGGRSANRGQCAQACRLPYELIVDGQVRDLGDRAYLLSPQDLAAHDLLGPLVDAGVRCFKIEGRLKSAHYVAAATGAYRAALDAALCDEPFALAEDQALDLAQSFSRGFTHGFLGGVNHQELVQGRFGKNRGVQVGRVVGKTANGVLVAPRPGIPVRPGDGVVFDDGHPEQDEQGGRVASVHPQGELLEVVFHRGDVQLAAISEGNLLWRTDDPTLRRRMERTYARDRVARRVPLFMRVRARAGEPLAVMVRDDRGHEVSVEAEEPLALAEKHPLTLALLREQLGRLGQTPFDLADLEAEPLDPVLAPKSVLNGLRRRAVEGLLALREARAPLADPEALAHLRAEIRELHAPCSGTHAPALSVLARSLEQVEAALGWIPPAPELRPAMIYCDFEDVRRYREAVALGRAAGVPIGLAAVRILKPGEEGLLQQVARCAPDAVLVRNLGGLSYFRERAPELPLLGDHTLNVANELTAHMLLEAGLRRLTPTYDLNFAELGALLREIDAGLFEVVLHQHMPMFHMEHCVFAAVLSAGKDHRDCGRPCDRHALSLRDRVGADNPVLADIGCRNTVFNGVAQSAAEFVPALRALGLRRFRVELLRERPAEARALLDRYGRVLAGLEDGRTTWRRLRVLNQLGVTRGTLGTPA